MAAIHSGFAKLIPANAEAKRTFSKCIEEMQTNGDEFHLRFYEESVIPYTEEATSSDTGVCSSEYDTDTHPQPEQAISHGHFVLSFEESRLPKRPNQGWTIGKGESHKKDETVDFLLARPRDPTRKHIARVHVLLKFNRHSGLLMLVSASAQKPVSYLIDGEWVGLKYPSQHVLFQRVNKLRIHRLEYDLVYTLPPDEASVLQFQSTRAAYLRKNNGWLVPHDRIPGVPPKGGFKKTDEILMCNTAASGGFGWVSTGVNANTGDPVAIKEMCIRSKGDLAMVKDELEMGRKFKGVSGLLPILKCWCEHGYPAPCGKTPEKVYLVSPLGTKDFKDQDWSQIEHVTQLYLFKMTLLGLKKLHEDGIMHRDITRRNLLVLSVEHPDAVVFDYGKAICAVESTYTFIGPIPTLAPEVYSKNLYTNKIDVWAWAYAISETLGYKCPSGLKDNGKIDHKRYTNIQSFLNVKAAAEPRKLALINLIIDMLSWDPTRRPSIEDALRHPCWNEVGEEGTSLAHEVLCAKKVRISDKDIPPAENGRQKMDERPKRDFQHNYKLSLNAQQRFATPTAKNFNPSAPGSRKTRQPTSPEANSFNDGPTQPFSADEEADESFSSSQALRSDRVKCKALTGVMQQTTLPGQRQLDSQNDGRQLLRRK